MIQIELLVVAGERVGSRYTVPAGGVIIGRSRSCDFSINEEILSRQHCNCYVEGDVAYLQDLGSANGTLINGDEIDTAPYTLHDGDIITLGGTVLRVTLKQGASVVAPSRASEDEPTKRSGMTAIKWSESLEDDSTFSMPSDVSEASDASSKAASKAASKASLEEQIDLGLEDDSLDDDVASDVETGSTMKTIIRLVMVALVILVVLLGALIFYKQITTSGAKKIEKTETVQPFENTLSAPFDLTYEHLSITDKEIFKYRLSFASTSKHLVLHSENLGDIDRSFKVERELNDDQVNHLRQIFLGNNYTSIAEQYPEQGLNDYALDRRSMTFVLGNKIWSRTSENFASNDYADLCLRLEAFVADVLALPAASYTVAELVEFARANLEDANDTWSRISQRDSNIRESYKLYTAAETYLLTINPKPEFAQEIRRGIEKSEALMEKFYEDYKFSADQARLNGRKDDEALALKRIMDVLLETDNRYRQAEQRLEIIEHSSNRKF